MDHFTSTSYAGLVIISFKSNDNSLISVANCFFEFHTGDKVLWLYLYCIIKLYLKGNL